MTPTTTAPVFGRVDDTSVLDQDASDVVEFTIIAYDFVPHPTTGERAEHKHVFHAIPQLPGEKVIAAFARGKNGEIHVGSLAKIILQMLVVSERDDFLDFIEDVNLTFVPEMIVECLEYLIEQASDGLPKALSSGSSRGERRAVGRTSTGGRSGRAALERETSR